MRGRNKKTKNSNNSAILLGQPSGNVVCPPTSKAVLRFQDYMNVSSVSTSTYRNYSMNSAFDPLYDTGGGTCTGYQHWLDLYEYCMVSKIAVQVSYQNAHPTIPSIMFIIPYNSSQTPVTPNLDYVKETPYALWWPNYAGPSSYNPHTMRHIYSNPQIEGRSLNPWRSYSSTQTADPILQLSMSIGALAADGVTPGFNGLISVEVSYSCIFWQKKIFAV